MGENRADYRHTYLLFGLIGVALVAGLVIRALLVPETFGQYGHYRAAAPLDIRALPREHIGERSCASCKDPKAQDHAVKAALHDKDAHSPVPCEDCHGPGAEHAARPKEVKLLKPEGRQACLGCHQLLAARPGWFPQVDWQEHFRFVGVADQKTACTACHDPHEPLFMDRDLRTARLHPLIQRCRDCHTLRVNEEVPRPADHPPIFACAYCHAPLVADFEQRTHHKVRCTTCHIFFRVSDFAGRILRDADPRFCLLCHGNADFRSDSAPPGIDWPDGHLNDVAETEADRSKRCIDCHQDRIHLTLAELRAKQDQAAASAQQKNPQQPKQEGGR